MQIQKDLESVQADLEIRENRFFVDFYSPQGKCWEIASTVCSAQAYSCIFTIFIWGMEGMLQLI